MINWNTKDIELVDVGGGLDIIHETEDMVDLLIYKLIIEGGELPEYPDLKSQYQDVMRKLSFNPMDAIDYVYNKLQNSMINVPLKYISIKDNTITILLNEDISIMITENDIQIIRRSERDISTNGMDNLLW